MTTYYMHTLDGKPAAWDEVWRRLRVVKSDTAHVWAKPVTSLDQINEQQELDRKRTRDNPKYGYIRFTIEGA